MQNYNFFAIQTNVFFFCLMFKVERQMTNVISLRSLLSYVFCRLSAKQSEALLNVESLKSKGKSPITLVICLKSFVRRNPTAHCSLLIAHGSWLVECQKSKDESPIPLVVSLMSFVWRSAAKPKFCCPLSAKPCEASTRCLVD